MPSPINGQNQHLPIHNTTTQKASGSEAVKTNSLGRNIKVLQDVKPQLPTGEKLTETTALADRSIASTKLPELTREAAIEVAGAPKEDGIFFAKSKAYKEVLTAIENYDTFKNNFHEKEELLLGRLQNIEKKLNDFLYKKETGKKNKGGEDSQRIRGLKLIAKAVQAEKVRLTNSVRFSAVIGNVFTKSKDYDSDSIASQKFYDSLPKELPDSNGSVLAKDLFIRTHAKPGSSLHAIAEQHQAEGVFSSVLDDVSLNTLDQLDVAKDQLKEQLKGVGLSSHYNFYANQLTQQAYDNIEASSQSGPIYENLEVSAQSGPIYGNTEAIREQGVVSQTTTDVLKEDSLNQLTAAFKSLPDSFKKTVINNEDKGRAIQNYNDLPKPKIKENAMLDSDFTEIAQPRFQNQGALLACNKETAARVDGKMIYHANYVQMPSSKNIAAQGPRMENAGNYWKTLSSQNVDVSVDLTDKNDRKAVGMRKSIQYTPEVGESTTYDNGTTVKNLGEFKVFGGDCIVQKLEVDGKIHHRIQLTTFVDRTPGNAASLVATAYLARQLHPDCSTPIAAHCIAGIGRTGTFLSILEIVDSAMANKTASNVESLVENVRRSRGPRAVQTYEQLETIKQSAQHAQSILTTLQGK